MSIQIRQFASLVIFPSAAVKNISAHAVPYQSPPITSSIKQSSYDSVRSIELYHHHAAAAIYNTFIAFVPITSPFFQTYSPHMVCLTRLPGFSRISFRFSAFHSSPVSARSITMVPFISPISSVPDTACPSSNNEGFAS